MCTFVRVCVGMVCLWCACRSVGVRVKYRERTRRATHACERSTAEGLKKRERLSKERGSEKETFLKKERGSQKEMGWDGCEVWKSKRARERDT